MIELRFFNPKQSRIKVFAFNCNIIGFSMILKNLNCVFEISLSLDVNYLRKKKEKKKKKLRKVVLRYCVFFSFPSRKRYKQTWYYYFLLKGLWSNNNSLFFFNVKLVREAGTLIPKGRIKTWKRRWIYQFSWSKFTIDCLEQGWFIQ